MKEREESVKERERGERDRERRKRRAIFSDTPDRGRHISGFGFPSEAHENLVRLAPGSRFMKKSKVTVEVLAARGSRESTSRTLKRISASIARSCTPRSSECFMSRLILFLCGASDMRACISKKAVALGEKRIYI